MSIRLGVIMDPISGINIKKDSTFALLLAAQARGWPIDYMELGDVFLRNEYACARMRRITLEDNPSNWYQITGEQTSPLAELSVILMRKDPPFDMEYVYVTYILEHAEAQDTLVVNKPQSLRDANEKMFASWFPQCRPPTLVTRKGEQIRQFLADHGEIVLKPLDSMGGASVFHISDADPNINVIIETLTKNEAQFAMAQRYIPEITAGDKRILMIDGEPFPYALARVPPPGDIRGNLAVGASAGGVALTDRDRWICAEVGPVLRERGLLFVGLDVIGDYLTEINVTSPTCIRELEAIYQANIAGQVIDAIEHQLSGAQKR